jgi:hypothetical protein
MPRPVYILCSESGSQDLTTGLLSHFQVIETLNISAVPFPAAGVVVVPALMFRATAVWMRNADDLPEQEYEYETAFYFPPEGAEQVVQQGKFIFEADKPLYRMIVIGQGPPLSGPGLFRIENRIRKVGQAEWLRQDYHIPIVAIPQPPPAVGAGAPHATVAATE